jgi:cobaltochelatase CobN
MHLLATTSGVVDGAAEAVNLKQSPGDVVVLSAADSEIANLACAVDQLPDDAPQVRLANLMQLQHNYSVDLYAEETLLHAKLIVVRLLGGKSYWPYGIERLHEVALRNGIALAVLPGGTEPDSSLACYSTVPASECERLRRYLSIGGPANAAHFLKQCFHLIGKAEVSPPPETFEANGTYHTDNSVGQRIGIVFYRSVIEGGLTAPIDGLIRELEQNGNSISALYVSSLKDMVSARFITDAWTGSPPEVILNATSFAVGNPQADPLAAFDCPVLQIAMAGTSEEDWRGKSRGLAPSDLAMSVVLPEIDGRIFAGAISFKVDANWHSRTQCRVITYKPIADRLKHVAELAARWAALRTLANADKKIAIILANYPNKDGRIANGVGYDTPASTNVILNALADANYTVHDIPESGNALIEALQQGRTNALISGTSEATLSIVEYLTHFEGLPTSVREQITERWGDAGCDPFIIGDEFHLPLRQFGHVVVGIQPARGYNIDPKSTYHDAALVPPHGYLAFYFWLRHKFAVHAVIHNGKHGNLEWLPGKAVGLSDTCYPEVALGALPQLYPFIVNDPGEGTQAKRRTSAIIIDHLTPPLTRAETYGPLKDLEALVDEYYLASGLDKRRLGALKKRILDLTRSSGLDTDAGFTGDDDQDLQRLDAFLCDLKEAQIRDGLHILGASPQGRQETDLLVALTRVSRGLSEGGDQSLIRALALDFNLDFDPLNCQFADHWNGPRPLELVGVSSDPWRSTGDTVERLELLAANIVAGQSYKGRDGNAVIKNIEAVIRPTLLSCGPAEINAVVRGVAGKPIAPGPSGAPTRGRLDVLPTGRNFYSIDNRTLPTPVAWELGKASADALLTRHFQDTGQNLVSAALSAWGTSNMRTGGDDIAQAMALVGVKPMWDSSSWRVTGYEVIPLAKLGRPRVDVTLRISGFFRDAFPMQIELLDKAMSAIATLDEPAIDNPMANQVSAEIKMLVNAGVDHREAEALSSHRIFGSKPGAYGAGLQTLIDEGIWSTRADLAATFVTWGSYAYGAKAHGTHDEASFRRRLASVQAVIHNQDNREHDLLDSDDYYQFEGGMSAAVQTASGAKPRTYHNDHSRPDRPVIRTLDEEVARVVRSRVVNPKWINGVKRHGYKGAFEIAATVDYMFAFAATTDAVKSHHFDLAYDAYLADEETLTFITQNNPAALKEIAARLEEAISRGLWQPRLNSAYNHLRDLQT